MTDGRRKKRQRQTGCAVEEDAHFVRTVSESVLKQLQVLQIGRDLFGSETHRPRGNQSQYNCYAAQGTHVSPRLLSPLLSLALAHGLEVVVLSGQQVVFTSKGLAVAVVPRQMLSTVEILSLHRLSCLISGGFQDLESRG